MKDFIENNKNVLLDEIAKSINNLNQVIQQVISEPIPEKRSGETVRTYFIAVAQNVGNLTALMNEYLALVKGINGQTRPTGFASLIKSDKKEDTIILPNLEGLTDDDDEDDD
jgi:hypothetical protein